MKRFLIQILTPLLVFLGFAGADQLGMAVPKTVAVYEDSLQSKISSSATSLTLVRGTDKAGTSLSGQISAVIDEGSASEEFMLVTCTGTACTINLRGLDPINPSTEVTALKFEHRRGASFKVTDYPQLAILSRILNGDNSIPNILYYDSIGNTLGTTTISALATKGYVDTVGAGGFTAANIQSNGGIYALGTSPEKIAVRIDSVLSGLATSTIGLLSIKSNNDLTINGAGQLTLNTSTQPFIFGGNFKVSTKVATTSVALWVGSGGTANSINLAGGDIYVQDDVEIDGTATSTTVDATQYCFGGVYCHTDPISLWSKDYYIFTGGQMEELDIVGTGTFNTNAVTIGVGATTTSNESIYASDDVPAATNFDMHMRAKINNTATIGAIFGLFAGNVEQAPDFDNDLTIGFHIKNGTLFAINSNGTNSTDQTITAPTLTDYNDYRIIKTGTSIAFYVNGTLQTTLTTTTPATLPRIVFGVDSGTTATRKLTVFSNWMYIAPR